MSPGMSPGPGAYSGMHSGTHSETPSATPSGVYPGNHSMGHSGAHSPASWQSGRPLTSLIPYIPSSHIENFMVYFRKLDRSQRGYVSGNAIGRFFRKSGLNEALLANVWDLSDVDNDGRLSSEEFCIAMHLINCVRQGAPLPDQLPDSLNYKKEAIPYGVNGLHHHHHHQSDYEEHQNPKYRGKSAAVPSSVRRQKVEEHPDRNRARTEPEKLQRIKQRLHNEHTRGLKVEIIGGAIPPPPNRHQSASPYRGHAPYRSGHGHGQQRRTRRGGKAENGKLKVIRNGDYAESDDRVHRDLNRNRSGNRDRDRDRNRERDNDRNGSRSPKRKRNGNRGRSSRQSEWPLFSANMSLKELSRVRVSDTVDFRKEDGKYVAMEVVERRAPSHLSLGAIDGGGRSKPIWCDYHIEMFRVAEWESITRRPVTRQEMLKYKVGDIVDVNPYHTMSRGWTLGVIAAFDCGQAQIRMARDRQRAGHSHRDRRGHGHDQRQNEVYWVHLDNPMEAAPPGTHSAVKPRGGSTLEVNEADDTGHHHRGTARKRRKSKGPAKEIRSKSNGNDNGPDDRWRGRGHGHGRGDRERGKAKERGSSYPNPQTVRTRHFEQRVGRGLTEHIDIVQSTEREAQTQRVDGIDGDRVGDDERNGYRSPFHELEQNPNSKLKLLPQDSNASETAGFVMVNYPTTEIDENEDRKIKGPNLDSLDEDLVDDAAENRAPDYDDRDRHRKHRGNGVKAQQKRPRGRRQRSQSKQMDIEIENKNRRWKRPHSASFRETDRLEMNAIDNADGHRDDRMATDSPFGDNVHHSKRAATGNVQTSHRPVIQFGGAMTDKEVQYVLERLSGSRPSKRHQTANGNALGRVREHGVDATAYPHHHSDDEQQRRGSDLRNGRSRRGQTGRPNLENRYSNTAPSTPLGVGAKYGKRQKSKRERSRSRKQRQRRHRSKSRRAPQREQAISSLSFQTDMV